jgi:cytochrome c oxidase subunit 3
VRERRLADQFEDLDKQAQAARFGMWLFLATEIMLFAVLFTVYAYYRAMYPADWAAAAGHNSVAIGTINTLVLLTSSLAVAMSVHEVRAARPRRAAWLLVSSVAMGAIFLVLKGVEYAHHFHDGIFPGEAYRFSAMPTAGARTFFTTYFVSTGLHALHVTAGMVLLGVMAWRCFREVCGPDDDTAVELSGLYWHLVDVIWIFLWPLLYLLHA